MVRVTHRVSFLRVRKDPFNRLLALCVNCFRTIRFSYLLHEIQILLPDVRRMDFLPLFICPAFRFARAVPALFRYASVGPLSIPVRRGVPQDPTLRAGIDVGCRIVGILPRLVSVLPPSVSCIRKHRDSSVLYRFLRDPRGLVARVHRDELYFIEFPCDFIIHSIPCHAVMDVPCRYLHAEDKPTFIADRMRFIRKLPFMLSFYEHSTFPLITLWIRL